MPPLFPPFTYGRAIPPGVPARLLPCEVFLSHMRYMRKPPQLSPAGISTVYTLFCRHYICLVPRPCGNMNKRSHPHILAVRERGCVFPWGRNTSFARHPLAHMYGICHGPITKIKKQVLTKTAVNGPMAGIVCDQVQSAAGTLYMYICIVNGFMDIGGWREYVCHIGQDHQGQKRRAGEYCLLVRIEYYFSVRVMC